MGVGWLISYFRLQHEVKMFVSELEALTASEQRAKQSAEQIAAITDVSQLLTRDLKQIEAELKGLSAAGSAYAAYLSAGPGAGGAASGAAVPGAATSAALAAALQSAKDQKPDSKGAPDKVCAALCSPSALCAPAPAPACADRRCVVMRLALTCFRPVRFWRSTPQAVRAAQHLRGFSH